MSVALPRATITKLARAEDVKTAILECIGDLSTVSVMQNMVLVATYIRPEKTSGGLFLPDSALEEDIYQGKVGLVLKKGPVAGIAEDDRFDVFPDVGDWCVYRVGDAWDLTIRNVHCRLVADYNIRLVVNDPEEIF
jgi:co-chaperonin GroES (HSP10)